jgi:hypothetical protein
MDNAMRDKIAETVMENDVNLYNKSHYLQIADAIIAALPSMVKPLVWEGSYAHSGGGTMYHLKRYPEGVALERFEGSSQANQWHDDEESAKEYANAHHVTQVMVDLGVTE